MNNKRFTAILIAVITAVALGCASRYRLDLYLTTADGSRKVKVEGTEFVRDAVLNDPLSDRKLMTGEGNCVILNVTKRGDRLAVDDANILGFDEYFRCRVYIQLPTEPEPGSVELLNNSFAHILGRFELPTEAKIFMPDSGRMVIDSLTRKYLYATIDGNYRSHLSEPLSINGRFKVKVKK